MRKKIIALLLMIAMSCTGAACNLERNAVISGEKEEIKVSETEAAEKGKLNILRSDLQIKPEDKLAQIKAEYLLENNGYSDKDEVVAIIELPEDSIIDRYLEDDGISAKSVAEYASSTAGVRQAENIASKQNALISQLKKKGLITGVNYTYSTIVNAVAVTTTYGNFKKLEKYSGVSKVALSDTFNRVQAQSDTDASAIVNAVEVYPTGIYDASSVSYTGEGTAVAVLDSGFDCSHSVFDVDLTGKQLLLDEADISGLIANGKDGIALRATETTPGLSLSDVYESDKIPFAYDYANKDADVFPFNSEHGTHVAGIIGGYDASQGHIGIAPHTQLVLLKVFPDIGEGAQTEDILAALEDAVLLNVDAINMSLGSSCGFARESDEDLTNKVYDRINESGISLITAASNSYSSGFGGAQGNTNFVTNPDSGTIGSPSTYAAALSVASISGVKSKYLIANDEQVVFFDESNSISGDKNDFFGELYKSLGKTEGQTVEVEYVTVPGVGLRVNYSGINVKGKVALVRRGDSTFEDKALQAKNAGAIACIIYNNIDGDIIMSMGKTDHIPTISISKDDGTILAQKSSGKLVLDYKNQAGPFMSDFSSWGPLPDLQMKPEITAHGGNIRSAVPGGEFDELSGTSMASPNLCGIVVLIRQFLKEQPQYKDYSWKQISILTNQMLMSTATIVLNEQGIPYSPRKQGAGLASLFNVVNTKAYLTVEDKDGNVKDKSKIELYDDAARKGVYEMTFNVVNTSDKEVRYNLSLVGMSESVSTSDPTHVSETGHILDGGITATKKDGNGSVANNVVTVAAGSSVKVSLTYKLTDGDKDYIETLFPFGMYVEGFVKLEAVGGEKEDIDLNVPFLAYYGDWTQAPMFDKTFYEVESEAHDASIDEEDKLKADYYATTPYGSYLNNYIIPLGQYLYDVDTVSYDEIAAREDHIAISDYLGTIDGIQVIYAGLLRNAKKMVYTITDKVTGEVVYKNEVINMHKAHSNGGTPIPGYETLDIDSFDYGLTNNRVYEFKMQGYLDYGDGGIDTNIRNSFSFDFYLDNEAPVIKEATYEKVYDRTLRKDRYYINLTIYDNHYVQSINPVAFYYDEGLKQRTYTYLLDNPIPVYSEMGTDNNVRIEITEYLDNLYYDGLLTNALGFAVDDYALNTNIFLCMLPGTSTGENGTLKFTTSGGLDDNPRDTLTVSVDEVADLTQYLATSDPDLDEGREYLKYLTWTSANERVAVVREGQIRGVGAGVARITVSDRWWGNSASITVRVTATKASAASEYAVTPYADRETDDINNALIESMRFVYFDTLFAYPRSTETSEIGTTGGREYISALDGVLDLYPGEQIKLAYDVEPWYVQSRYTFTYSSANPSAVTITPEGVLTAVKEGVSTVTLSASGSTISASLRVNVKSPFVIDEARTLVAYKGKGDENGVVEIPDDEGIMYIGPHAFSLFTYDNDIIIDDDFYANRVPAGNPYIKKVIVPEGVSEIQQYAFYNCTGLEEVVLPSSIKFIMQYAFYNCQSLTTINLYEDNGSKDENVWVEAIGGFAFYDCVKLDNIDLSHVYSIGEEAFSGARSLSRADLTSLRNTGANTFIDCTGLKTVIMDPDGKTKLAEGMFMGAGLTSADIYEKKQIPAYCFAQCYDLAALTIHNSILSIEEGAFFECTSLKDLTLPDSDFIISAIVFTSCSSLETLRLQANTNITFENSISYDEEGYIYLEIGSAFGGSKIKQFVVDSANTRYKTSDDGKLLLNGAGDTVILAATGAEFGEYTLPEEITTISAGAFSGTDITILTILNKDLQIGDFAFAECLELTTVNFPETAGTLNIGNYAFYTIFTDSVSKLETLNNSETIKTVGDYAFARTVLTEVKFGEGTTCGEGAFFECKKLLKVEIGANSSFGGGAFQDCALLEEVVMPAEGGVTFGPVCFAYDEALTTIDLSMMKEIDYQVFFGCLALASVDLANVEVIGEYAFAYCSHLESVNMPKVKRIEAYAFTGDIFRILEGLTSGSSVPTKERTLAPIFTRVELPDTLEFIGEAAFATCWKLSEITIPSGIEEIADYTFAFCEALETVTLPDSVKSVGEFAFAGCLELSSINLGKVEEFNAHAFTGDKLQSVDLTEAVVIGYAAFANCEELTGEIVANNLELIGDLAFTSTSVTGFEASKLAYIGAAAFNDTALTEFTFSEDIGYVGANAFAESTDLENFYFGSEKSKDGVINEYALLSDGILYTLLPNGNIQLSAVPGGKDITVLEVLEGTVRIEMYAGSGNTHIEKIILPDSLQAIGNYAFYNYTALKTVEFKSVKAPAFENYFEDLSLNESAPGYNLLHKYYGLFGWELCYNNIIGLAGENEPINMILPANSDISGYDSIVYEAYFGKLAGAERSEYVAMQTNMRTFVDLAAQVIAIGEININHEKLVTSAVTAMNGITQDYKQYGYTDEEWTEYVTKVTSAKARILELKLENASKTARDVQARINQLPDKYNGEAEWKAFYEQLTRDYNLLTRSDREALDSTRYTAFRASFDSYVPDEPDPVGPDPVDHDPDKGPNVLAIVLPIVGGVIVLAAVVFAVLYVRKKKSH